MTAVAATASSTGPLFNGSALRQSAAMVEEIVEDVANDAFREVQAALGASLQNPTGFYESRIAIDRTRTNAVVHDSGVVYGPWLAGVSSRNATSRFKGYAHWMQAKQRAERNIPQTTARTVRTRVRNMN